MQLLGFSLLVLLVSPALAAGYALIVVVALRRVRGSGVSVTALSPLSIRAILHQVGRRDDPLADTILGHLPMVSPLGLALFVKPLDWATRVSGYPFSWFQYPVPGSRSTLSSMVNARTTFFDRIIEQHRGSCRQLVILGAGYDTRAFTHGAGLAVFEVDAPDTQRVKRQMLDAVGAAHPGTLVAVDFNQAHWLEALKEAGFDPSLPTIVLWEGVTYYLPDEVVKDVLRSVATLAVGSVVAFDYFGDHWIHRRVVQVLTRAMGEPFRFGISTEAPARTPAAALVGECGLRLRHHDTIGFERPGRRTFGGFVVAAVPASDASDPDKA